MENELNDDAANRNDLEDELERAKGSSTMMRTHQEELESEISQLKHDLDECKSQVTVAVVTRDNIEMEKRKCEEELASLQQIMKDAVDDAVHSASGKYEKEIGRLKKMNDRLEMELQELRNQGSTDKEGMLSVVTKTIAKRVVNLNAHSSSTENLHENLEESMKKAQEDAEMLRSLVVPLEEEINALKDKLRAADDQLRMYEGSNSTVDQWKGRNLTEMVVELDDKLKELNEDLKAEKSSRSDLEMYVAVLQTQKTVLQEDADKLRKEMQEVCRILEVEKREHTELKHTWQMANDQFLEVQRLQIMDMRRMQSLLTMEQQRMLSEMQKRDEDRMEQERKVQRLLQIRDEQEKQKQIENMKKGSSSPILARLSPRHRKSPSPSRTETPDAIPSVDDESDYLRLDQAYSRPPSKFDFRGVAELKLPLATSGVEASSSSSSPQQYQTSLEEMGEFAQNLRFTSTDISGSGDQKSNLLDLGIVDESDVRLGSGSESSPSLLCNFGDRIPSLTEAQFKALADLTPEQEARKQLLESARARPETLVVPSGKRLVSEKEWQLLQEELKKSRDKLGQTCVMCSNYEAQLQKVQEQEKELEKQVHIMENSLGASKEDLQHELEARRQMEEKMKEASDDTTKQVSQLMSDLEKVEKHYKDMRQQFMALREETHGHLRSLGARRDEVQADLTRLQNENDVLVGKHSAHSQQMQNEDISLPLDTEEMHHLLLKLREELIDAKVAKEHMEENLKSEILFLKDQVTAEQHTKDNIEDTLTQEIDTLREQVGILESIKMQVESEQSRRSEAEKAMKEAQSNLNQIQAKSRQIITALQKQLEEHTATKMKFENEVLELKCKVQTLQTNLDTNEAVQNDFVKLSQSLQMQLEKIRQSDTEVRWQHEEDANDCSGCKQPFSMARRKRHCHHCGKIFCSDCTVKAVASGPNRLMSKVCDVCHTLLVRDTKPYFSDETPHTPD